ncbi:MAG: uL15 family ribosomal protein [Candidatus Woesearchaeota archaeon]|nr:uL15 family ribosomal protein [Candidatus Woesearchaeota archaeon]
MTVNKRRKVRAYRGSKAHGGGSKKKRRGSGHRGGVGRAGSGKRADQKKPSMLKLGIVFGKHGFKKKNRSIITAVNLGWIETHLPALQAAGTAQEKGGVIEVDLKKAGYNKVLSAGHVTKKWALTTEYASAKVREKVEKAGGKLIVLNSSADAGGESASEKSE